MLIDFETIKKITFGNTYYEHHDDGSFSFHRLSAYQEEVYEQQVPTFHDSARCDSGIYFDFITDSASFSFQYFVHIRRFEWYGLDCYIDGNLTKRIYADNCEDVWHQFQISLDGKQHRIQIFFPLFSGMKIKDVCVDDLSHLKFVSRPIKILVFGDSITHGFGCSMPSTCYTNRLSRKMDVEFVNQSIGGEVFRKDIIDMNESRHFDAVLIAEGTNDWSGKPLDRFINESDEFFRKIKVKYPNLPIYYISPVPRFDTERERPCGISFEEGCQILKGNAMKNSIILLDGFKILSPSLEFSKDGLHPNDLGYEKYEQFLSENMKVLKHE